MGWRVPAGDGIDEFSEEAVVVLVAVVVEKSLSVEDRFIISLFGVVEEFLGGEALADGRDRVAEQRSSPSLNIVVDLLTTLFPLETVYPSALLRLLFPPLNPHLHLLLRLIPPHIHHLPLLVHLPHQIHRLLVHLLNLRVGIVFFVGFGGGLFLVFVLFGEEGGEVLVDEVELVEELFLAALDGFYLEGEAALALGGVAGGGE